MFRKIFIGFYFVLILLSFLILGPTSDAVTQRNLQSPNEEYKYSYEARGGVVYISKNELILLNSYKYLLVGAVIVLLVLSFKKK
jgi:hypothetical protein